MSGDHAEESADRIIDPVGQTAEDVAVLVRGVPGVQRLHGGLFGEVATYLPGRRVSGIRIAADRVEVHVVLDANVPIRMTAERIHALVHAATRLPVHVVVEDIAA
ncbi:hypothetical protein [Actinoplanes subglobosus]|uniref:Asp23/Gls24 family envelope stress response protein n=1 Tax=Actinoplanes subglobosus TaxID=1547892 RepID=A0ABV8J8D5_9ACTN